MTELRLANNSIPHIALTNSNTAIQSSGNEQSTDNAQGQIALGLLDLTSERGHSVKTNVSKEYLGCALEHSVESVREELFVVRSVYVESTGDNDE